MNEKTDGRKKNGGPNRGAGRKKLPAGEKRVPLTIKVKPELKDKLKTTFKKGEISSKVEGFIVNGLSEFNTF